MNEPSTVITDYVLGLVSSWVAFQLFKSTEKPQKLFQSEWYRHYERMYEKK